jgi:hypothetical protein
MWPKTRDRESQMPERYFSKRSREMIRDTTWHVERTVRKFLNRNFRRSGIFETYQSCQRLMQLPLEVKPHATHTRDCVLATGGRDWPVTGVMSHDTHICLGSPDFFITSLTTTATTTASFMAPRSARHQGRHGTTLSCPIPIWVVAMHPVRILGEDAAEGRLATTPIYFSSNSIHDFVLPHE